MKAALRLLSVLSFFAVVVAGHPVLAVQPDEMLKDPVLEARARDLSAELRCLVCQNESIDASDADLAHDLRVLIRQRITAGDTNEQVIDYLVARYGEFILLKPRFNWHTVLLWAVPPGALALGAVMALVAYRRRRGQPGPTPLDAGEQAALERLLSGES
jgi:cytochrome c-type biogenesis protein CcmH